MDKERKSLLEQELEDALESSELTGAILWIQADRDQFVLDGIFVTDSGNDIFEQMTDDYVFKLADIRDVVELLRKNNFGLIELVDESTLDVEFNLEEFVDEHLDDLRPYIELTVMKWA